MFADEEYQNTEDSFQSANNDCPKCKNCTLEELAILREISKNPSITQKELAEAIQYSDPMSSEQLYPLESKIAAQCAELNEMVENHESEKAESRCDGILKLMAERNRKCAILK